MAERKKLVRILRQSGLSLQLEAVEVLLSFFGEWTSNTRESSDLSTFADRVASTAATNLGDHMARSGAILDKEGAFLVVEVLRRQHLSSQHLDTADHSDPEVNAQELRCGTENVLQVLDAFSLPKPVYSVASRAFVEHESQFNLCGDASDRAEMFRARYHLLLQRLQRDDKFSAPVTQLGRKQDASLRLTLIESLLGSSGEAFVFGLLSQLEDSVWYLEDPNASVRLDLSEARSAAGVHTENSFVVVAGEMSDDGVFKVSTIGSPSAEARPKSAVAIGRANFFGGVFHESDIDRLTGIEEENADAMFLFFVDVWVDQPHVVDALRRVFRQLAESDIVPRIVVLMGTFLSYPFGQNSDDVETLSRGLGQLGRMIAETKPVAENTHFILVPGPTDPGPGRVLPRPGIPSLFVHEMCQFVTHVTLASNPCRVRYCAQEIVLFREDISHKMLRHAAVPCIAREDEGEDVSEHVIKSILDQSHLSPVPPNASPVIWNHDSSLWLFPVPHVLVTGERADGYSWEYVDCKVFNPGSFPSDYVFFVYIPAIRSVQPSCLNQDQGEDPGENAG